MLLRYQYRRRTKVIREYVNAMSNVHELLIDWIQSSRELSAAIREEDGDIAEKMSHNIEWLNGYLASLDRGSKNFTEDPLALAGQHVAKGTRIVERQKQLVDKLRHHGQSVERAQRLLETYRQTLSSMREHLRNEEQRAAKPQRKHSGRN